jgi:hypothetical protein
LLHGRNISRDGSGGLGQGDPEFGKSLVYTHGLPPSTGSRANQASRVTVKPAKL